jgi:hypothetical protein
MKRDMDLLRALLLNVEELPYKPGHLNSNIEIPVCRGWADWRVRLCPR